MNEQIDEAELDPELKAALDEAIAVSQKPNAKWYTTPELEQELDNLSALRRGN